MILSSGVLKVYYNIFGINLEFFGLVVFFIEDFRCAETIPATILVEFGGFRAFVIFIEDFRCAETIPGTILGEFGAFRSCDIFSRGFQVC